MVSCAGQTESSHIDQHVADWRWQGGVRGLCLFLWLGLMSPLNYSPQALCQTNFWHTGSKRGKDKRPRVAWGDRRLKGIKGERDENWCVKTTESFYLHRQRGSWPSIPLCADVHWFLPQQCSVQFSIRATWLGRMESHTSQTLCGYSDLI